MGSIGGPEVLIILVVALLVLGPTRLPEAARQAGRAIGELRRLSSGFQAEMRDAFHDTTHADAPPPSGYVPVDSVPLVEQGRAATRRPDEVDDQPPDGPSFI